MPQAPTVPAGARPFALAGGVVFVASLVFFGVSFATRFDATPTAPWAEAAAIDVGLFTIFALHHSLFARTGLKRVVQQMAPAVLERSIYVWLASLLFIATCWWWQPVAGQIWETHGVWRGVLSAVQIAGGVATLAAARRLDVLDLAGVRHVLPGPRATRAPALYDRDLYALVRHPIYLGWTLMVWLPPTMNGTRLVFAAVSTFYLAVAVPLEEKDLIRHFGPAYTDYQRRVKWRMVPFLY